MAAAGDAGPMHNDAEAQESDPLLGKQTRAAPARAPEASARALGRLTGEIAEAYSEVIPASQHSHGVGSLSMGE
jgi:hypothetical protein